MPKISAVLTAAGSEPIVQRGKKFRVTFARSTLRLPRVILRRV